MTHDVPPLSATESEAWRALIRAFIVVPRVLESELEASHGLTLSEYFVLVNLSEATDRRLRMTELARRGAFSLSAMSRVVDRLAAEGLVCRVRPESDARGYFAVLNESGLARLTEAYPSHLRGVRRHVMDHLAGLDLGEIARTFSQFAGGAP